MRQPPRAARADSPSRRPVPIKSVQATGGMPCDTARSTPPGGVRGPGLSTKPCYEFRSVVAGVETFPRGVSMPRHHHNEGYATVVLSGSITEVSFAGRSHAEAGHVLLHGRFDCHLDYATSKRPLQILRLPWRDDAVEGRFRVTDPDVLARLAEKDPNCASALLRESLHAVAPHGRYWVDDLAEALRDAPGLLLAEWAENRGLRPDTVSSVFGREFGVSPKRFRMECHTRVAWREVMCSATSLTDIAHKLAFSDLAHLSRSIHALTGRCPRDWRVTASVN